jgi:transketolase
MNQSEVRPGFTAAISVSETHDEDARIVEKPFGRALVEAGRRNPTIVGLTADLGKYTDIDLFGQEFPERYFQVGMAEQNLIGVAAGLSRVGYIPFATTYCVFASRRAYDFIAIDVALGRANVKIIAGLPGLTTGYGATHQGIDDLALMRAIPNMVVIDPCDATEIEQAVHAIAEYDGPVYMRLLRGKVKAVLNPKSYQFELGKAVTLREGRDIALVSTGIMTERALEAAEKLSKSGIAARVLHVSTLKPLDQDAILQAAAEIGVILTLENHSTIGGLGSAAAEVIALAGVKVRMTKVGIQDRFIECGSVGYLTNKYGLSTPQIVKAAQDLLANDRHSAALER